MALITFNADLTRVADALERIAAVLEFAFPPPVPIGRPAHLAPAEERVHILSDEDTWLRENLEDVLRATGQPEGQIPAMAERVLQRLKENQQSP